MATGALDVNGIWQYGEDDSETTFSALLNKLGTSISSDMKGRILQVVSSTTATGVINSTTTYVDTGLTATITPKKSSSKIIVLVNQNGLQKSADNSYNAIWLQLVKNGTSSHIFGWAAGLTLTATNLYLGGISTSLVDTHGVTTPITYKTQFRNEGNFASVTVNGGGSRSTMILIEVSA